MSYQRYTSILLNNKHVLSKRLGDNLDTLMVKLLLNLEYQGTSSVGIIRDNTTGKIVQQYRKSATE